MRSRRSGTQYGFSWARTFDGSAATLFRLQLRVQAIDDRPFPIRIVLTFQAVVGGGELDVRFNQIGSVPNDRFEHRDSLFDFAGLQAKAREQLARREVLRAN